PCGPINNIAQAFDDPQVKARGLHIQTPRTAGDGVSTISTVASPLRLTKTPPVVRRPPPAMGQHTNEILAEMGRTPAQIAELHSKGVV
ncbi:MAG: CoA transferase, partial [Comamonas sp.]